MHLVKLPGTDPQINQFKGNSSLTASEIREKINANEGRDRVDFCGCSEFSGAAVRDEQCPAR